VTKVHHTIVAVLALSGLLMHCTRIIRESRVDASTGDVGTADSLTVPFTMPAIPLPEIPPRRFDIRDFGAKEGGVVKSTAAIQSAIDSLGGQGGGTVVIPAGRWLTGALHFQNHINLFLEKGAELLFSQDPADYLPAVFSRHEDIECYKYSAFIYANGRNNISITGEGTLNGQGKPWWEWKELNEEEVLGDMVNRGVPVNERIFDGRDGHKLRPAFFQPMNCTNILVQGVTFLYGAFWTITPTYCDNITVRNVHLVTEGEYGHTPNGDGVDPSSSRNVLIENCVFDTGDDCIAIKSGRDKDGLRVNMPTENVVVRGCRGLRGHGGIVIGSETSGGIRNILASDCSFRGTDRIVRIKTSRGRGGVLENMWFRDLSGEEIRNEAIHLNMLYSGTRLPAQIVTPATPTIRNIHFDRITCASGKSYAVEMLGLPERAIQNITLDGITAAARNGIHLQDVDGIEIRHSQFHAAELPALRIADGMNVICDSVQLSGNDPTLVRIDGKGSRGIIIRKSNIIHAERSVSLGPEVSKEAVRISE